MKGVKVEVGISQIGASEATSPLSLATGPGAQCIRIGVMKDNFVFDHFLHFFDYTRVQLG